jgi:hypothetical protein
MPEKAVSEPCHPPHTDKKTYQAQSDELTAEE